MNVEALQHEVMAVTLARLLRDGETVFFGFSSPLPMTAALLAKRLHAPNLVILNIPGGVNPAAGMLPGSTVSPHLVRGSSCTLTLAEVFDMSARGMLDTVFLRGAQVDSSGRINNSCIGDFRRPRVRLPGGGGGAFFMPTAGRTLIWTTRHDRRTLVERVEFATASGRAEYLVTPCAVFRRIEGRFHLQSLNHGVTEDWVRRNTGFEFRLAPGFAGNRPPSLTELEALRRLDPGTVRALEFKA